MRAYIGIGANLGDREATLREALRLLGEADGVEVVAVSSLVETEPWGYADQPAFLNGAAGLETTLHPRDLLALLLDVERRLGRVRTDDAPRYGPRTVDLDLLVQGDLELDEPGLQVPHPRLHERRFALAPLAELDPALVIPGQGCVADLLAGVEYGDHVAS